ncbi:MAG: hypothetical protein P9M12_00410 [Candidatus Aceula lacicola]|nr:hypothetical protein [Candidatus Aceula lacicola]
MKKWKNRKLLRNPEVLAEIHRHLWIESEKSGHDIGFDNAAEDWLRQFSDDWAEDNMPKKKFFLIKRRPKAKMALEG